ncbi:hypothetical protein DFH09DRAFT_905714 [Mycena vulgaris]|nr:hypothetical protein DFH09DRAFT_905714 [Mycena vulgaris]
MASPTQPQTPLPPSNPQLPKPVWKKFKKDYPDSIIFSPNFSTARHLLVTGEIPASSSDYISYFAHKLDGIERFLDLNPSWLHLATLHGDLALACEALRLGSPIQLTERRGFSALYFGCRFVEGFVRHGKFKDGPGKSLVPENMVSELMKRYDLILQVCIFLVEQHSDPNEAHKGLSLLHLACVIGSWDLIHALLLHGAKPSVSGTSKILPIDMLESPSEKARFTVRVSECSIIPRPPRPCPCASGRPLSECHATSQPYPGEYICPCMSRKIHAKCCQKKDAFSWHEFWDDEKQFDFKMQIIQPMQFTDPADQAGFIAELQSMSKAEQHDLLPTHESVRKHLEGSRATIQILASHGMVDLAFAKAVDKTGLIPRPGWTDTASKLDGKGLVKKWNLAVDDYIASGDDHRGRRSIEDAAKIGMTGGPLYRKCEADGCGNVEGRESVKLLVCSGCVTAVYCSKSCQKSAWKAHREPCRSGRVKAQVLPSQRTHLEMLARVTGVELHR